MIIHQPEKFYKDGNVIVWARVETSAVGADFPELLWYRVPERFAAQVVTRSDAFLIPCLLGGMYFQESIEVRGSVSPRLAYHLEEYQYLLNHRMGDIVRPVGIQYERLEAADVHPSAVCATFSGGADSFFTLLQHESDRQPSTEYHLTHCLFINGFDIVRTDESKYSSLYTHYQKSLASVHIDLVPIETNAAKAILPRLVYPLFFSVVLAGSAMALSGLIKRFIIASSYDFHLVQKSLHSASTPLMDRLLSTETLDIEHHGGSYSRAEKVATISSYKPAQENLRVCGMPNLGAGVLNCSRCEKCTRTMIPLYAERKMENFVTFQLPYKKNRDLLWWGRKFSPHSGFVEETLRYIRETRPDLLPWLRAAAILGYIRYGILKLVPSFVKKYLTRYGMYVDHYKVVSAFENPEVLEAIEAERE